MDSSTDLFIDKGTYGCVLKYSDQTNVYTLKNIEFTPYFQSKTETERNRLLQNAVVKVMFTDEKELLKERQMNELVSTIDPDSMFTVPIIAECKINISDMDLINNKCDKRDIVATLTDPYNYNLQAFIMPYEGVSIQSTQFINDFKESLTTHKLEPRSLALHMFISITSILKKILEKGYVHRDIKTGNILYDKNTLRFKIIDFGIACKGEDVYHPKNLHYIAFPYKIYPPEFPFIAYLYLGSIHNNLFKLDKIKENLLSYIQEKGHFDLYPHSIECNYKNMDVYLDYIAKDIQSFTNDFLTYNNMEPSTDNMTDMVSILRKGLTQQFNDTNQFIESPQFITFFEKMKNIQLECNCTNKITMENIHSIMNDIKAWESVDLYSLGVVMQSVYTLLEKESYINSDKHYIRILGLIQSMTYPDMLQRCSMEDAITELNTIKKNFNLSIPDIVNIQQTHIDTTHKVEPPILSKEQLEEIERSKSTQGGRRFKEKELQCKLKECIENQDLRGYLALHEQMNK